LYFADEVESASGSGTPAGQKSGTKPASKPS
jgi:hypothetical protein